MTANDHADARGGSGRSRKRRKIAIGTIVVAVAAIGSVFGGAVGANAYAKSEVCDSLPEIATAVRTSQDPTAAQPDPTVVRDGIADLRSAGRMLIFDADLRLAVSSLATGLESGAAARVAMRTATPEQQLVMVPEIMAIGAGIDGRLRDGQRACGKSETGIGTG